MTINSDNLHSALAAGNGLAQAYEAVWRRLWDQPYVPAESLELCRLRLSQLHGADADTELRLLVGIGEEKVRAAVAGRYEDSTNFSAFELVALELAEVYAQDPAAISDAMAAEVKKHVGEPGLVCLVEALGFIDGRIRLSLIFNALASDATAARGA
jgi:hypothetical protein